MARIGKPYIFWGVHGRICPDNSAIKELHEPVIRGRSDARTEVKR
jgi:hypothetical protein